MGVARKSGTRKVGDHYVALVHGGEPEKGCRWIEMLVCGKSRMSIIETARSLGVWSPSVSSSTPSIEEAVVASQDALSFVWRMDGDPSWRSSAEFQRLCR